MRIPGVDPAADLDSVLLLVCLTAGAVVGFSITGGAAVGTALGAAAGMALVALRHRRQRWHF